MAAQTQTIPAWGGTAVSVAGVGYGAATVKRRGGVAVTVEWPGAPARRAFRLEIQEG